ncbi:MAG: hypothetical protein WBO45_02680, partial [Planctomycetota bacterium]
MGKPFLAPLAGVVSLILTAAAQDPTPAPTPAPAPVPAPTPAPTPTEQPPRETPPAPEAQEPAPAS